MKDVLNKCVLYIRLKTLIDKYAISHETIIFAMKAELIYRKRFIAKSFFVSTKASVFVRSDADVSLKIGFVILFSEW